MPSEPFFVDANVPMYARGQEHSYRSSCRQAMTRIANEPMSAFTSAEVLQEILHRYVAIRRAGIGRLLVDQVATLVPNVLPVTKNDILHAARLSAKYPSLPSRDLVHLAVMLNNGIGAILTVDTHFDGIPQVTRIDPREF